MKKILSVAIVLLFVTCAATAQDFDVTGTVKDENGEPMPSATVEVKEKGITTFTDTLGFFRITAQPNFTLVVSAAGFEEETIRIAGHSGISIVLKPRAKSLEKVTVKGAGPKSDQGSAMNDQLVQGDLFGISNSMGSRFSHSGITAFSHKEETKGSRYLFSDTWGKGEVVTMSNFVSRNPKLSVNYDKITHSLFLTEDNKKVMEVDKEQIRSFDLKAGGQEYNFKKIKAIDSNQFFQVITESPEKYSLYKLTKTRFVKSNYHSDGMVESGVPYDEYLEENYYFVLPPGGQPYRVVMELRIKALKEILNADIPKAAEYLSKHRYDKVDEAFLKDMVDYINQ
ncbi:MAG TPA: carboxypeptidase-like regulatory domain-containing protein [Puia sp.]|nr:carboxypeptidase-like regulatory domain-containing protein [Puia sp.]